MKLIPYFSFFKFFLLLVFLCLFFVSKVSADQCVDFTDCGRQEQEKQKRQAEERKAMEQMAEDEYQMAENDRATRACKKLKANFKDDWPGNCNDCNNTEHLLTHDGTCETVTNCDVLTKCRDVALQNQKHSQKDRELAANVEPVDMTKCDGKKNPSDCCYTKQNFFKSFWPSDNKCNCEDIRILTERASTHDINGGGNISNSLRERVIECIGQADQKVQEAKSECISSCGQYITRTTEACKRNYRPPGNYCETEICSLKDSGLLEKFVEKGDPMNFYKAVESTLSRENCLGESEQRFISAYKSKCLNIIGKLQNEKQQTILCDKRATKENPGCDGYCEGEAKDKYGNNQPGSDQIVEHFFNSLVPEL